MYTTIDKGYYGVSRGEDTRELQGYLLPAGNSPSAHDSGITVIHIHMYTYIHLYQHCLMISIPDMT